MLRSITKQNSRKKTHNKSLKIVSRAKRFHFLLLNYMSISPKTKCSLVRLFSSYFIFFWGWCLQKNALTVFVAPKYCHLDFERPNEIPITFSLLFLLELSVIKVTNTKGWINWSMNQSIFHYNYMNVPINIPLILLTSEPEVNTLQPKTVSPGYLPDVGRDRH